MIEGTEGVGKGTQVDLLCLALQNKKKEVFVTKEPGTPHNQLTMDLRKIMLDVDYDLPRPARELMSQTIRSIHQEKVVNPSMGKYDYVIQDRGILSAVAYGMACKNSRKLLFKLSRFAIGKKSNRKMYRKHYSHIILLVGDPVKNLVRAQSAKKEFKNGDAMEAQGGDFMIKVQKNFLKIAKKFKNVTKIYIDGKSREEILAEILVAIGEN